MIITCIEMVWSKSDLPVSVCSMKFWLQKFLDCNANCWHCDTAKLHSDYCTNSL